MLKSFLVDVSTTDGTYTRAHDTVDNAPPALPSIDTHPALPNMDYTTKSPRGLACKIVQDFYHRLKDWNL